MSCLFHTVHQIIIRFISKSFQGHNFIPVTIQMKNIRILPDKSAANKLLQRHLRKSINIHSIPTHKQSKCLDLFRLTVWIHAIQ